jgi:hypothetical protein
MMKKGKTKIKPLAEDFQRRSLRTGRIFWAGFMNDLLSI